jgi:hypothetical protein
VGSGIRKKPIPDPGSGGQKGTGSRIRIRNTAFYHKLPHFFAVLVTHHIYIPGMYFYFSYFVNTLIFSGHCPEEDLAQVRDVEE